ncbi:MAG: DNA polymerase subunit [Geobacteraceae bacterium]|nr:MAG: DNA polymerase subunit [Geobacteraceae bacterium]
MPLSVRHRQQYGELISSETIAEIAEAIARSFSPERIILFGSYADGHPTPDSDLDLLVVMNTPLPRQRRAVPLQLLFKPMPCPLDILVYTPEEVRKWNGTVNHIITHAFSSGRTLYERQ